MISCRLSCCGFHPSSRRIFSDEATSRAESPARRAELDNGDRVTGYFARGLDHCAHRIAGSAAEVVNHFIFLIQRFQREQMCGDQIRDVNVIADACAIGCWIIRAEDGRRFAFVRVRRATPTESNAIQVDALRRVPAMRRKH